MYYFDCCCEIGPRGGKDPAAPWNVGDALRWMDHCGIAGALVCHTLSGQCDPTWARQRLAGEISRAPRRLFPAWDILPPDAGDFERDPDALVRAMNAAGARAARIMPRSHAFPFNAALLSPQLSALEREGFPVLIDYGELPEGHTAAYAALNDFLDAFPRLAVILRQASWSCQRVVTALMERHANLHLEFSKYQVNRGLETYVSRFGARRLLFGTGLTAMSAGAARAYLDYARIAAPDRALIAGGNLTRLLGGVRPDPAPEIPADPLRKAAAMGRTLPRTTVLDAHCHLLHEGGNGAGAYVMYRGDADGLVEIKDLLGVSRTAIMTWAGPVASDPGANEITVRACRRYPDRFAGVAYINPTHAAPAELVAEVRRLVEKEGFLGLKPYYRAGPAYNDPLYNPCWEYANQRGLYVLMHLDAGSVPRVACDLAARFPRVQWVVAHSGGSFEMARAVAGAMKQHGNLWAELTLTPVTNGVIEWLVSEAGDDRVLFGTDAPMRDPRPQFGWVVWADIGLASRRRILGGNFARLLKMVMAGGAPPGERRGSRRRK